VPSDRLLRILTRLRGDTETVEVSPDRLCEVSASLAGAEGAGIMLMSERYQHGSVCHSNAVSALIDDLQFSLGEGPGLDAYYGAAPVLEPDLTNPQTGRWAAFAPSAVAAGVRSIFGFPLQVGGFRVGALNLYRNHPGALDDDQHADTLVMAGVAARALVAMQVDVALDSSEVGLEVRPKVRLVIHQASGMAAGQLHVSVEEALYRLRAYAFGNGRSLEATARDVMARRLRFDTEEADESTSE
jgi:hypothetical protein